mgnify:CR=1 FL=1
MCVCVCLCLFFACVDVASGQCTFLLLAALTCTGPLPSVTNVDAMPRPITLPPFSAH